MIKINNWEDLIALAKEQGLTPKEAWERIEKTNLKFLNRKSSAEKELKKGTRVQRLMFPKNNEENILLAKNVPSLDVSGDFYNFKNLEDKIFFTLGDVSGKGVDAGLIMARVTSLFEILVEEKKSLIEIVSLINDNLYNLRSGKFLTGIFAVYDKKSKNLEFINAGHSECIISENKEITEHVSNKIPPLGVQPINFDLNSFLNKISLKKKIFYIILPILCLIIFIPLESIFFSKNKEQRNEINKIHLKMRPLKNAQFRSSSRKAKILTAPVRSAGPAEQAENAEFIY